MTGNVLGNDYDPDFGPSSIQVYTSSAPSHGTLTIDVGGSFTYNATDGYSGSDSFEYTIYDGADESYTATVSIEVGRVKIMDGVIDITDQTQDVWVSDFIQPFPVLSNAQGNDIESPSWTVPGYELANWDFSQTPPQLILPDLNVINASWFWVDGGDGRVVTFSGIVAGQSFTVQTTYNVERPDISLAIDRAQVEISPDNRSAVFGEAGPPPKPGIKIDINELSVPNGGYQMGFIQVVNSSEAFRTDTNDVQESRIENGTKLDGGVFYPGQIGPLTMIDFPSEPLGNPNAYKEWSRDDSFSTYVMFQRAGGGLVPLRVVSWSWGFEAETVTVGGVEKWELVSSSRGLSPVTDTTGYPTWNGLVGGAAWQ